MHRPPKQVTKKAGKRAVNLRICKYAQGLGIIAFLPCHGGGACVFERFKELITFAEVDGEEQKKEYPAPPS